jgi:hypothetical protein
MQKAQLAIITLITVAFLWATMPGHAHAEDIPLCHMVALPGPAHTLNPRAPKAQQVQEKAKVCDYVLHVEGRNHRVDPIQPVIQPPAEPFIA